MSVMYSIYKLRGARVYVQGFLHIYTVALVGFDGMGYCLHRVWRLLVHLQLC